jgi:hypothetical protein
MQWLCGDLKRASRLAADKRGDGLRASSLRGFIGTRSPFTLSTFSAVVQRFLVSPQIVAIALCQADYIDSR